MYVKLKILTVNKENIYFEGVHRVMSHRSLSKDWSPQPWLILVKLMDIHDKPFIRSFIKNLPRGTEFGISNNIISPKKSVRLEIIMLYLALKAVKHEKKVAYFKVEKLFINATLYCWKETSQFF